MYVTELLILVIGSVEDDLVGGLAGEGYIVSRACRRLDRWVHDDIGCG